MTTTGTLALCTGLLQEIGLLTFGATVGDEGVIIARVENDLYASLRRVCRQLCQESHRPFDTSVSGGGVLYVLDNSLNT